MSHVLYVFKDMKVLNYKIHLLISILLLYSVYNDNGTNYHGEIPKTHNCVKTDVVDMEILRVRAPNER